MEILKNIFLHTYFSDCPPKKYKNTNVFTFKTFESSKFATILPVPPPPPPGSVIIKYESAILINNTATSTTG